MNKCLDQNEWRFDVDSDSEKKLISDTNKQEKRNDFREVQCSILQYTTMAMLSIWLCHRRVSPQKFVPISSIACTACVWFAMEIKFDLFVFIQIYSIRLKNDRKRSSSSPPPATISPTSTTYSPTHDERQRIGACTCKRLRDCFGFFVCSETTIWIQFFRVCDEEEAEG